MQVVCLIVVIVVVFKMIAEYEPLSKRIATRDADPNNSIKSDKWYSDHPEVKGK